MSSIHPHVFGQTYLKGRYLLGSVKLSNIGPGWYLQRRQPGNALCRKTQWRGGVVVCGAALTLHFYRKPVSGKISSPSIRFYGELVLARWLVQLPSPCFLNSPWKRKLPACCQQKRKKQTANCKLQTAPCQHECFLLGKCFCWNREEYLCLSVREGRLGLRNAARCVFCWLHFVDGFA